MTTDHNYFEVLCALAATRQLTLDEAADLHEHFEGCLSCREKIGHFTQTGCQLFYTHATQSPRRRMPGGMTDRFVARSIREGVPLSQTSRRIHGGRWHLVAMIGLALVFMAVAREHIRFLSSSVSTSSDSLAVQGTSARMEERTNPLPTKGTGKRIPIQLRKTTSSKRRKGVPGNELSANAPAYLNRHFKFEPNQAKAFLLGYTSDGGVRLPNGAATSFAIPMATAVIFHPMLPISDVHALKLLASCESCVFNPGRVQTSGVFERPMARNANLFDTDSQRWKKDRQFPLDLSTFQPVKNAPR